jgi:hypothetical protein
MDKEQIIQWAREAAGLKCNCCTPYFEEDDIDGFEAFLEAFAKLVAAHERNKLAAWMIQFGFATGHGDTMEQLCDALSTEIVDRIDGEVEAAIRARSNT